jgi:hypothetical protein
MAIWGHIYSSSAMIAAFSSTAPVCGHIYGSMRTHI